MDRDISQTSLCSVRTLPTLPTLLTKDVAKSILKENQILCNYNVTEGYFIMDSYQDFLDLIKNYKGEKYFYESTPTNLPCNLFFDIDVKETEQNDRKTILGIPRCYVL